MLCYGGGGGGLNSFFLSISSSWVNLRLHTENQLYTVPGSALTVCVVVGGVESQFSDRLWQELSLGQAEQLNCVPRRAVCLVVTFFSVSQ